ncbi:MAG: DUF5777 family beta-barrel protein [Prolixibacteraceae bacterium]|jgi:hypothetical protein|nr:DUF5777 family beta-barrel protein [Prolixibacteraceae bacterium]MCK9411929.1 DUF5777 family beta-barrel protein [Prolixibacteraceae bacterium]
MKKTFIFLVLSLLPFTYQFAQGQTDSTATEPEVVVNKPVRFVWESGYLIDQQTSKISPVNTLESVIQHKFGGMGNGRKDLFGIMAPGANVRIALDYVIAKNLQVGYGLQKKNMYSDFNAKWTPLQQMNTGMPISVSFFGNVAIDGRQKSVWEADQYYHSSDDSAYTKHNYRISNRLSYFASVTVARKVNNWMTIQAGASLSHFNTVPWHQDHDKVGLHVGGRIKVSPQGSLIFNGDFPLQIQSISEQADFTIHPEPNVSFGYEVSTSTHAFQIYVGSNDSLLPQDMMLNNMRKLSWDNFSVGFTITRLWGF